MNKQTVWLFEIKGVQSQWLVCNSLINFDFIILLWLVWTWYYRQLGSVENCDLKWYGRYQLFVSMEHLQELICGVSAYGSVQHWDREPWYFINLCGACWCASSCWEHRISIIFFVRWRIWNVDREEILKMIFLWQHRFGTLQPSSGRTRVYWYSRLLQHYHWIGVTLLFDAQPANRFSMRYTSLAYENSYYWWNFLSGIV